LIFQLVVLLRGKNLSRKALFNSSQVVMQPDGKKCNQALALSLNGKGNKRTRIASLETPFNFSESHTSKQTERYRFGSSKGVLSNWDCYTMKISAGLSLKLLASTVVRALLKSIPWTLGVTKSWRVLLSEFHLASRLWSSILYFFLLKRKILLISRSGSYKIKLTIN